MMKLLLLPAALLFLLHATRPEGRQAENELFPFTVVVQNKLHTKPYLNFTTSTVYRGILLGGLTRLMDSNAGFKFDYTIDPNYGPFLESVNGLAGSDKDHTYWELLVYNTTDDELIRPDVGIGCYIPNPNDVIILNFTTW